MSGMSDPFGARHAPRRPHRPRLLPHRAAGRGRRRRHLAPAVHGAGPARDGAAQRRRRSTSARTTCARSRRWPAPAPDTASVRVPAGARAPAGLHGRARGRRPRRDAHRDGTRRAATRPRRPAGAGRPRDRPLGAGRLVRHAGSPTRATSSASTSATTSATRCCAGRSRRSTTSASCRPAWASCHQVNLEYLARVVQRAATGVGRVPDTLVGTDSHTTMVNGLGVLGWGVGGIEAEAVMLGQPLVPARRRSSSASRSAARCRTGVTATDLVLTLTEMLRKHGVVGKFVEFCGDGLSSLSVARPRHARRTWRPSTAPRRRLFPVDAETLRYLRADRPRRRAVDLVERVHAGSRASSAPTATPTPTFTELLELDLDTVEPSLAGPAPAAGPRRARQRAGALPRRVPARAERPSGVADSGAGPRRRARRRPRRCEADVEVDHGAVVIAAITRCTNTSNPSVMVARGPARQEGGRARPGVEAVGQDEPRAGLARRHRLPRARRA